MSAQRDLTSAVKALALEEGFAAVAVAPPGRPPRAEALEEWLRRGWHADMRYMERNLPTRLGDQPLMEGARSVICLAVAYASWHGRPAHVSQGHVAPAMAVVAGRAAPCARKEAVGDTRVQQVAHPASAASPSLVAAYARGRDYHRVLKRKCLRLMDRIRSIEPGFQGRAQVDSAPVMERGLAAWSGLGWIGRNGCLFVPGLGSYVLLCEIVCNLPLAAGRPLDVACGNCGACVEACPTGAIGEGGLVDARKCISYLTIECRGEIPSQCWPKMGVRLFGCDRCQEACPHNRPPATENGDTTLFPAGNRVASPFSASPFSLATVLQWSRDDWDAATRGSACRRATWEMFLRNAAIAAGNSGDASLIAPLEALGRRAPERGGVIAWAVGRLRASAR